MTVQITAEDFKRKIFNYNTSQTWKYEGNLPAIVDFYADWCGPCRMVAPILEELANEYKDKIIIYKVNTETEPELSTVFGIRSIPTFLFIPLKGEPALQPGAFPKQVFKQIIDKYLLGENS